MAAIDWVSAQSLLHAVLPAGDDNPIRTRGLTLEARLQQTGEIYDAAWTTGVSAAKDAAEAEYSAGVSDLTDLLESLAGTVDHAARVVEALQAASQSGPMQYRGLQGKEAYGLAPDVSVPWDGTGDASATAQLTLLDGATPVMALVAKDAGTWGNTVEVSVEVNAGGTTTVWTTGSGAAGTFPVSTAVAGTVFEYDLDATPKVTALRKVTPSTVFLLVRRGDYSERYQLFQGRAVDGLRDSLLLASAEWVASGSTLPDALAWTALSGGAGGALAAVKARSARAGKLSQGVALKATLDAFVEDLDGVIDSSVTYPSSANVFVYAGKPVATEFDDAGTTYLVAGTNKGIAASLKPRQLSVKQLEARINSILAECEAMRSVLS